ncbi:MAG: hypothetical protein AAB388_03610 [Patescibacteria group bacterium]
MSKSGEGGFERLQRLSQEVREVVSSLKLNPNDLSVFHAWLDRKEKETRTDKDTLNLSVQVARIYRDAGLVKAAHEAYFDAADQALRKGNDVLYTTLISEAEALSDGE